MSEPIQDTPSLFLSERFVDKATGLGIDTITTDPVDVQKTIHLARHGIIKNLGGLVLHGPSEGSGNNKTRYHHLEEGTIAATGLNQPITKVDIAQIAEERQQTILALEGTNPTEVDLTLGLYRSARAWRDPNASSLRPDTWLGVMGGGALGLAWHVIMVGLEKIPPDLPKAAQAFVVGAAIGTLLKPGLAAARMHYDRPLLENEYKPFILGQRTT